MDELPTPPPDRSRARFFNLSRFDVMTRVFVAICYGLLIFGASFLPVMLIADCLSGSGAEACRGWRLPLTLLEGVVAAPFVFLIAFFFGWPLVVAALVAGLLFPRAIDAAPVAWTVGAGIVAWLLANLIAEPPRRRTPFPDWWLDRLWSDDSFIFGLAVSCVAVIFLRLTRRDRRRAGKARE